MKRNVHIFVEGHDKKFIEDYIQHLNLHAEVHITNGWTSLTKLRTDITRYKDEGNTILVVFDADTENNKGGYSLRRSEIENFGLPIDGIFLFPNNANDGALEDLLENIINRDNVSIFECWERFEDCLNKKNRGFNIPAKKSKIYVYLETLLGKTQSEKEKCKDRSREFDNKAHWNLDCEYLLPLKKFLISNL